MKTELSKHPIAHLVYLAKVRPILSFFVNVYERSDEEAYNCAENRKEIIAVPPEGLPTAIPQIIDRVAKYNWDVVISSRVVMKDGEIKHIPMIDFAIEVDKVPLEWWSNSDTKFWRAFSSLGYALRDFAIYASGRSYHAYGGFLMPEKEWVEFMCRLATMPGLDSSSKDSYIVDARWVGFRLLYGYGALRLSANDKHYLQEPQLVHGSWLEDQERLLL